MTTSTELDPWRGPAETGEERRRRHERVRARLVRELDAAADGMPKSRVRNAVCGWLASRGLMARVRLMAPPHEKDDGPDGRRHDTEALDRCATLAHRDPGHPGRLDMCSEELCRALDTAGAS